jgi:hypothetical protein
MLIKKAASELPVYHTYHEGSIKKTHQTEYSEKVYKSETLVSRAPYSNRTCGEKVDRKDAGILKPDKEKGSKILAKEMVKLVFRIRMFLASRIRIGFGCHKYVSGFGSFPNTIFNKKISC